MLLQLALLVQFRDLHTLKPTHSLCDIRCTDAGLIRLALVDGLVVVRYAHQILLSVLIFNPCTSADDPLKCSQTGAHFHDIESFSYQQRL